MFLITAVSQECNLHKHLFIQYGKHKMEMELATKESCECMTAVSV